MQAIFSIKLWIVFLWKMLDAVFPTVIILLAFSWKGLKTVKNTPEFRMFLIFLGVVSASRLFIFFSGLPYQGRYLYPIVVALLPIAAFGFNELIIFLQNLKVFKKTSPLSIAGMVIVAIVAVNAGKALYFTPDKQWIKDVSALVRKCQDAGKPAVLISGVEDMRIAYYSGAEFMKLEMRKFSRYTPVGRTPKCQISKMSFAGGGNLDWLPAYNIYGADDFISKIRGNESPRVFLFLDDRDTAFQDMFEREKAPFPFKKTAVFKEGGKKTFSLYERIDR
ncbi:MAG: hypothetical protein WCS96_07075 [Victivallales bacterium]